MENLKWFGMVVAILVVISGLVAKLTPLGGLVSRGWRHFVICRKKHNKAWPIKIVIQKVEVLLPPSTESPHWLYIRTPILLVVEDSNNLEAKVEKCELKIKGYVGQPGTEVQPKYPDFQYEVYGKNLTKLKEQHKYTPVFEFYDHDDQLLNQYKKPGTLITASLTLEIGGYICETELTEVSHVKT